MKFKVGDIVYCKRYKKYGIVNFIDQEDYSGYPVGVNFKDKPIIEWYTEDGRWADYEPHIVLIISITEKINKILKV